MEQGRYPRGKRSGGAALFTEGAAERCPEERQQLTGLEKKMAPFHKVPFKYVFQATLRVNVWLFIRSCLMSALSFDS